MLFLVGSIPIDWLTLTNMLSLSDEQLTWHLELAWCSRGCEPPTQSTATSGHWLTEGPLQKRQCVQIIECLLYGHMFPSRSEFHQQVYNNSFVGKSNIHFGHLQMMDCQIGKTNNKICSKQQLQLQVSHRSPASFACAPPPLLVSGSDWPLDPTHHAWCWTERCSRPHVVVPAC